MSSFTQQPTADVDLSAANTAALADLQAELTATTAATPAAAEPVEAKPEPKALATPVPTPAEPVETPAPAAPVVDPNAPPDDVDELKKGYLRHRDYTQKTMSLAEERRQAQAAAEQAHQQAQAAQQFYQEALQWRQLANNPEALARFAEQQRLAMGQPNPEEPISYAQLQQIRARDAQTMQAQVMEQVRNELVRLETGRHEAQFFGELDQHAKDLLERNPELKKVRGITRLIVEDARARKPQTAAEFKQFMAEEADDRAGAMRTTIKDHEQAAIMRHAKASAPSINPPGGSLPAVQAPTKRLKLGSTEFYAQIEQDLLNEKTNGR